MIAAILSALLSLVILVHCICLAARLNVHRWQGARWRFVALTLSVAAIGGGSLGVAAAWPHGPLLLLAGIAGLISFDRRRLYS
ncbi:MAG: hypothetical protein PHY45_02390 [Rhodocyclaceae bacterium]|nr:hypothetical protein [Rhodocyclaceae bacterium]